MEPISAAVEHVAAPVEPVLASVDKGSIPKRLQGPCLSPGGLPFLLAALPRYHILITPASLKQRAKHLGKFKDDKTYKIQFN